MVNRRRWKTNGQSLICRSVGLIPPLAFVVGIVFAFSNLYGCLPGHDLLLSEENLVKRQSNSVSMNCYNDEVSFIICVK